MDCVIQLRACRAKLRSIAGSFQEVKVSSLGTVGVGRRWGSPKGSTPLDLLCWPFGSLFGAVGCGLCGRMIGRLLKYEDLISDNGARKG